MERPVLPIGLRETAYHRHASSIGMTETPQQTFLRSRMRSEQIGKSGEVVFDKHACQNLCLIPGESVLILCCNYILLGALPWNGPHLNTKRST